MNNRNALNFNHLMSLVVIPIILIAIILGYFLLSHANKRENDFLLNESALLAKMIGNIAKHNQKFHIDSKYQKFNNENLVNNINSALTSYYRMEGIEYFIAHKRDERIVFLSYTTKKPPPPVLWSNLEEAVPMRKALKKESGIIIEHNHFGEKGFAAYNYIPNTELGLVIFKEFSIHMKPYVVAVSTLAIFVLILIIFLYLLLKKNETLYKKDLLDEEHRFQQLVHSTDDWVWEVNASGVYTYSSNRVSKLLGYSVDEVIGKTPFDLMSKEEASRVSKIFSKILLNNENIINLENINLHKDGHEVYLLTSGSPFFDDAGNLLGYRGINKDITELKLKQKKVELLAYLDSLTSLANRRLSIQKINEEFEYCKRNSIKSALLFIDIDDFKDINDIHGHEHGDEVLKTIASRIQKEIRSFDLAGRLGGDEFIVVIKGDFSDIEDSLEHINSVSSRLLISISQPILYKNIYHKVGASIGISVIPDDGKCANDIINNADIAMYKAKDSGKGKFIYFNELYMRK